MQLYPNTLYEKLGFSKIIDKLSNYCISNQGKETVAELFPDTNFEQILLMLKQTREIRDMLQHDDKFYFDYVPDVSTILKKAAIDGAYLLEGEFFSLMQWLKLVQTTYLYFNARREKYPSLSLILEGSNFDVRFIKEIEKVIGPEGSMRSDASHELSRIRSMINQRAADIRKILVQILRNARSNGWTDEKEITIRNDRLVIPILSDFKGKIKGFVQDVSGTGQTVFLEPLEAFTLNNELRELRLKERNEILKILLDLTIKIRPLLSEFVFFLQCITTVDVLRAKGKLAIDMKADKPRIKHPNEKNVKLEYFYGRHPLLVLQRGYDKVVHQSLKLDNTKRIMVISGPNAGGKSVAMQSVGLMILMTQCGLLIPVAPNSVFPIFTALFADIGDDQSVQNDLSTYSSHLQNMHYFLEHINNETLILIDEFGSGTDPQLGGPMAEALLESYVNKQCFGVITTHYSNIKDFAQTCPNTANASMRFDLTNISPTYQLEQGLPGSSYAIEIAERVGIPNYILERAKEKIGTKRTDIENLLVTLKNKEIELVIARNNANKNLAEIEKKNKQLEDSLKQQKNIEVETEKKRKKILEEARMEAASFLREANAKIEQAIQEIKEKEAEKSFTKSLRKKLEQEILLAPETHSNKEKKFLDRPLAEIQVGDTVRLPGSDTFGVIEQMDDKRAVILVGEIRTVAKNDDLVKVEPKKSKKNIAPPQNIDIKKLSETPNSLHIRGMRVEQALELLTPFLDNAILAGHPWVEVIHGKGTGTLKQAVRNYIYNNFPQIKEMKNGHDVHGGVGRTICILQ